MKVKFPEKVSIREVGPREGFQRDKVISTENKVKMINKLLESGVKKIQVASMVHPKFVPQWADAEEVIEKIDYYSDVTYASLVLNQKGLERILQTRENGRGINEVLFHWGCTDSVLTKNGINKTTTELGNDIKQWIPMAKTNEIRVVISVAAAFGCSEEGWVSPQRVIDSVSFARDIGADEVHIGDSTGQASPVQVVNVFSQLVDKFPELPFAVHFHNNRGAGLVNLFVLLQHGFPNLVYDTSFAEIGGCPFIGAAGNVSTEDFVCLCEGMGIETGIDVNKVIEAAKMSEAEYERPAVSHTVHCGLPDWWDTVSPQEYLNKYVKN